MKSNQKPYFKQTESKDEFYTEERCHIIELLNLPEDRSQSVARARVEPGVTTAWHRVKDTMESYYILSGKGRAEIGDEVVQIMEPHSILKIPANMPQRITNLGNEDLVFLCFSVDFNAIQSKLVSRMVQNARSMHFALDAMSFSSSRARTTQKCLLSQRQI